MTIASNCSIHRKSTFNPTVRTYPRFGSTQGCGGRNNRVGVGLVVKWSRLNGRDHWFLGSRTS
jgi:hypothetical protein